MIQAFDLAIGEGHEVFVFVIGVKGKNGEAINLRSDTRVFIEKSEMLKSINTGWVNEFAGKAASVGRFRFDDEDLQPKGGKCCGGSRSGHSASCNQDIDIQLTLRVCFHHQFVMTHH